MLLQAQAERASPLAQHLECPWPLLLDYRLRNQRGKPDAGSYRWRFWEYSPLTTTQPRKPAPQALQRRSDESRGWPRANRAQWLDGSPLVPLLAAPHRPPRLRTRHNNQAATRSGFSRLFVQCPADNDCGPV